MKILPPFQSELQGFWSVDLTTMQCESEIYFYQKVKLKKNKKLLVDPIKTLNIVTKSSQNDQIQNYKSLNDLSCIESIQAYFIIESKWGPKIRFNA